MHTRTYDETVPVNTDKEGVGDLEIRDFKKDLHERLYLDHYMQSSVDTSLPTADGYHKQVTMYKSASNPAAMTGTGIWFTKEVSGITEMFYIDSSGQVTQITNNGSLAFSKSAYSAFKATMSASQTISGDTKLNMDTEAFDLNGDYSNTLYKFIAPYNGLYFFQFYVNGAVTVNLKKNGTTVFSATQQGTYTCELVTGDYMELWSTGSVTNTNSHWSGVRLR